VQLAETRSRELLRAHGVYASEACDRCGKILGHVRFTIANEPGAWCSHLCRDGVAATATRKGGRPRKHKNDALRQQAYRLRLHVRERYETPSKKVDS
jgi:hypothetical protein